MAAWVAEHGSGVGLLRRLYPATWRRAMAVGMTADDVTRCCEDATVLAAVRFDPSKGKFVTLLSWYVRCAVQRGIDERLGWRDAGKNKPERVTSLDAVLGTDGFDLHDELAEKPPAEDLSEEVARVREALLTSGVHGKRFWEVLRRRHGLGCAPESLDEVGRRMGISKERVRQIEMRAVQVVRKKLGVRAEAA